MGDELTRLVWRGIVDANPWWETGVVPPERTAGFHRHAFETIYSAVRQADVGRGCVVLGPRRVGKTVLLHQVADRLIAEVGDPHRVCLLSLDDVALRGADLGELLRLVELRRPTPRGEPRYLLLDEVQHSPEWSGWLKRIADRRDPYRFLATGSSATALRRGGQDAGLGRWREMVLFPWSFREHVELTGLGSWTFTWLDRLFGLLSGRLEDTALEDLEREMGAPPAGEADRLEEALLDYLIRGGFPEVARAGNLMEARRRLRQDILDRALGRDVVDIAGADTLVLERLFLRICKDPGCLWNESQVASDLQISRPTVARYVRILEEAFLVFRLPNLASPIKGQPKVYLVAPAMRQALLGLGVDDVRRPEEWGRLVENAVAASMWGGRPFATQIGFWRKGADECDVVAVDPSHSEYIEVKRSGRWAHRGIAVAAEAIQQRGIGLVLTRGGERQGGGQIESPFVPFVFRTAAAEWLYNQRGGAGGTLRLALDR